MPRQGRYGGRERPNNRPRHRDCVHDQYDAHRRPRVDVGGFLGQLKEDTVDQSARDIAVIVIWFDRG